MKAFALLTFLGLCCQVSIDAQCPGSFTSYYLDANRIKASFYPRGNIFYDDGEGGFLAPYPSAERLSTIFASSIWIGGFDDAQNLKLSAETYPSSNLSDFGVGPLNSIGLLFDTICSHYDRAWTVYYEDIERHRQDYWEDFKIDDTIPNIFLWPARGNKHFESHYGFELPTDLTGMAPFFDRNGNDIYDPENGDFPIPEQNSSHLRIPDQMMWMVFNDLDTNYIHTQHRPIRAEIQLTAYAYHCEDNPILSNTIFTSYRIINRAVTPIDSFFIGHWYDFDLGCYADDAISVDSARNTMFVFNADAVDGDLDQNCSSGSSTYGNWPPVQTITYLNPDMHSFIAIRDNDLEGTEYHNLLNGQWTDGFPITAYGNGYNPDSSSGTTRFLFHGDPRIDGSWSSTKAFPEGTNQKVLSSIKIGRLNPGQRMKIDQAYMFHQDTSLSQAELLDKAFQNVDSLKALFWSPTFQCDRFPICDEPHCVWPGDFDRNGIADHRDYLAWGLMNGASGFKRPNGLVSWRGHFTRDWTFEVNNLNAKHADGDGNGVVDKSDLNIHELNLWNQVPEYVEVNEYPEGSDLVLHAMPYFTGDGTIRSFSVRTGRQIENILGLTYEIEYDTSLFTKTILLENWPNDSAAVVFIPPFQPSGFHQVAFVQADHQGIQLENDHPISLKLPSSFRLRQGKEIPDSTVIRLRNLKGIDDQGNDLVLGSMPLVIYKEGITTTQDPGTPIFNVYPNPATTHLYIQSSRPATFMIMNLQGQVLKTETISDLEHEIDISDLAPGLYLIRSAGQAQAQKFVRL